MDQIAGLYDVLMERGQTHPITHAGHYAINSLRLEKGFRAWGAELSPDDNPLEAGLGFAVDWNKDLGLIGQERLSKLKMEPLRKRMAIFTLMDAETMLWGGEIIYRNERVVGYTTSGSFGHSVGSGIAMGYVRNKDGVDRKFVLEGSYSLKVGDRLIPAKIHLKAPVS